MNNVDKITDRLLYDLPKAINEGIEKLIPVGEKAWDIIILGVRYDGIYGSIVNLLFIIGLPIASIFITKLYIKWAKKIIGGDWRGDGFFPLGMSLIGVIPIIGVPFICHLDDLKNNMKKAIMPEVYIIQTAAEKAVEGISK